MKRRNFLQAAAITTTAMAVPSILSASVPDAKKQKPIKIQRGTTILFQGDSITDAGREKTRELPNSGGSFGGGYAFLAASSLLKNYASEEPVIYNRGISGNKVFQLADRWQKDCIDLKPDILSILIGVNDYWHLRNNQYDGTVAVYERDFRKLLTDTRSKLPDVKLVICQPFILTGTSAVDESWVEPFAPYQAAAEKICREFNAVWVPFQKVFDEALKHAPATWWAPDGVHPSMAGAYLMAAAWMKAVTGISI
jgi:lysophospholipase L1-like esterase